MRFYEKVITRANARDFLKAFPDAVALASGEGVYNPHPFADQMESNPLRMAAYAAGLLTNKHPSSEPHAAVIGRGMHSKEFADAMAGSFQSLVRRRFDAQARHRIFATIVDVPRLGEPEPLGAVSFASALEDTTRGEYPVGQAFLGDGETATVHSAGRIINVSRETIINDDVGVISAAVGEVGVTAARREARLVVAALEANANLSDGRSVFHADFGNMVETAFPDGLAAALAALRNQVSSDGLPGDYAAADLVVDPSIELLATKTIHDAGLSVRVTAMAGLALGRYYLMASRDVVQSVAVVGLSGASHPLSVESAKAPMNFDGMQIKVRADTGAGMVGRRGIVRGGA